MLPVNHFYIPNSLLIFLILDTEIKTPETQNTSIDPIDDRKISDQSNASQAIGFQTCGPTINGDQRKEFMNNLLFNSFLNQQTPNPKTDNPISNPLLFPYIQNTNQTQQNNSSSQNSNLLGNSNLSQLLLAQFMAQNMKNAPMAVNCSANANPVFQSPSDINTSLNMANKIQQLESSSPNQGNESLMKEFQNRILGLLITQNKMLVDLTDKKEILNNSLGCLINEINLLK